MTRWEVVERYLYANVRVRDRDGTATALETETTFFVQVEKI